MKNIILAIMIMSTVQAFGQLNVKWQRAATPYIWRFGTYDDVLKIPYGTTAQMKDLGSDSSRPGALFYRTIDEKLLVWNGTEFKTVSGASNSKDVYQYSTNVNVTVGDTTTALELNGDGSNTDNRVVTLKSPSAHTGKSLKIFNYNAGSYINTLSSPIIDFDGSESTVLDNQSTYLLSSDGTHWKVVSKTKQVTGGGSGGSGGGGIIVNLD